MSDFKVQVQNLYGTMDSMEALEAVLQQVADGVYSVKANLRVQIRQRERIDTRLSSSANQLKTQRQVVRRVVSVGRQTAELYEKTEKQLLNIKAATSAVADPETEEQPFSIGGILNWTNLWKMVGGVGVVGQIAKTIASFWEGDFWEFSKDIPKLVGKAAKAVDGDAKADWWKKLFGWEAPSATAEPVAKGFGANFAKELDKYKISKTQSAGKNTAAVAKWVGDAVIVAERGVSNWEEFKDDGGWSNPRLYAETVSESALKIGSNMAISAAVGAAAVAVLGCTPVGWAAVGVGVATVATTVVVNWALDGISQLVNGNSDGWVENVSDKIIDRYESIGNAIKSGGESIGKWWKGLFS